jgi:uncharacterized protein with GYD domain
MLSAEEGHDDNSTQIRKEGLRVLITIALVKWRSKPTKEMLAKSAKLFDQVEKEGTKILASYWTLGRYDAVVIAQGKDEKTALGQVMRWGDMISSETLVAVPSEEIEKLIT